MDLNDYVKDNKLKVLIKTNSVKTKIRYYDHEKKVLRVDVNALPINNKANIEIIKFFTKLSKKKVIIKSGKTAKIKMLEFC